MRQNEEVLVPCELSPKKSLQWIDDSIIMGATLEELYDDTSRFLQQINRKNPRLNIEKRELVSDVLKLCDREVDKSGWKFDSCYVKGLLDRVKPVYLHELVQLIYTVNFISASIP
eukprot:snap_masked-scaffold_90-processed-gene-0.28-mRNA-1 protein AED:1.00 eAED:1.00 QI:0/-1/0/0/-1/1/1/0/114